MPRYKITGADTKNGGRRIITMTVAATAADAIRKGRDHNPRATKLCATNLDWKTTGGEQYTWENAADAPQS